EVLGARRKAILGLRVGIVRGGVEVAHRGEFDRPAVGFDRRRGQAGQSSVQRIVSQRRGEDQEAIRAGAGWARRVSGGQGDRTSVAASTSSPISVSCRAYRESPTVHERWGQS